MRARSLRVLAVTAVATFGLAACRADPPRRTPPGAVRGDPSAGAASMVEHGCGSCHRIPGIAGARSLVGPPLDGYGQRSFVAGTLPNSQESLETWLLDPPALRPGTAMPDLDLTPAEARDIAAYLLALR